VKYDHWMRDITFVAGELQLVTGRKGGQKPTAGRTLILAALGVFFGDIGTSPLYAVQTIFEHNAIRPVSIDGPRSTP
jgi:hypothetical protein